MNSDQLLKFKTIAECGSMTEAAKQLFLAQSTLSYTISQLEEELDVKLFVREKKKLIITDDGMKLLQFAEDVDNVINNAKNAFDKNRKLRISANNVGAAFLLSNYPQSDIKNVVLYNMDERTLLDNLTHGKIDIAVCDDYFMRDLNSRATPSRTQKISKFLICREQLGLLVGEDHPLYKRHFLKYEELQNVPLCVRIGNTAIKSWTRAIYEKTGFTFKIDFEIDDYSYNMLRDSILYPEIVCTNSVVDFNEMKQAKKKYKFIKIEDEYANRMVYMWYLQRNYDRVLPLINGLKAYYLGQSKTEHTID